MRSGRRLTVGNERTRDSGRGPTLPRPPSSPSSLASYMMPSSATVPRLPGGRRVARLVDEHALEPLRGWVLIAKAVESADLGRCEALAREAYQLGRISGDRYLELCALTQIGVALIDQVRITEGMAFYDEATAGALAREGQLDAVVFTACKMMISYSRCAQYQRLAQWIQATNRFVERYLQQ